MNAKKSDYNYPCECGHSKVNHLIGCKVSSCTCCTFKPDNLKYLENQYGSSSTN